MLKKILDPATCAACPVCCVFDSTDVWEQPVLLDNTIAAVKKRMPDVKLVPSGSGAVFDPGILAEGEDFYCPMLDKNTGCTLGADKPFDCRIWPFRIMNIGSRRGITVSTLCKAVTSRPLSELLAFLEDGLADEIFSYAETHPDMVKPYEKGYPVLLIR